MSALRNFSRILQADRNNPDSFWYSPPEQWFRRKYIAKNKICKISVNVFFKKIFKSFPNRQNFKIFPQRACKHLQNTKKYVIINKLISITIKNGLMVKRLRRCPLTAESAVRFRMGLPKKIQHHLVWCCIFLYAPKRNDAATCLPSFVNLRKQILAVNVKI